MTFDHRILTERLREWISCWPCGCAFLLRTHEQVAYCSTCPVQLKLPL